MKFMRRRDMCYFIGLRAGKLTTAQAAQAWSFLSRHLDRLGERDVPKFIDLLAGIRAATIHARSSLSAGGEGQGEVVPNLSITNPKKSLIP